MARKQKKVEPQAPFDPDAVDPEVLAQMKARLRPGTRWAAYRNQDMSHPDLGRLTFLHVGEGCTFAEPPKQAPDSASIGLGWRYLLCGFVNLDTGRVEP